MILLVNFIYIQLKINPTATATECVWQTGTWQMDEEYSGKHTGA